MDTVWIVLAGLLLLVGAIGSVAPVLPGVPLCWVGLLLLKFIPTTRDDISWKAIVWLGVLTTVITVLDNVLPVWGTKKLGGNKKVIWGASIGLLVGFFSARGELSWGRSWALWQEDCYRAPL